MQVGYHGCIEVIQGPAPRHRAATKYSAVLAQEDTGFNGIEDVPAARRECAHPVWFYLLLSDDVQRQLLL